jgi:hypothetical protein
MTNEATPTASDAREERGRQLARAAQIRRVGRRWAVPSQTRAAERYLVDVEGGACTCPDFEEHRKTCKHQHAVLFWIAWGSDVGADGSVTETVTIKRKTYPQKDWRAYDASQTHERAYVERLLRALRPSSQLPHFEAIAVEAQAARKSEPTKITNGASAASTTTAGDSSASDTATSAASASASIKRLEGPG